MKDHQQHTITQQEAQLMAQALDVAARRGAYGAAEMSAIGQLHQRLTQMLKPQEPAPAPEPTQEDR